MAMALHRDDGEDEEEGPGTWAAAAAAAQLREEVLAGFAGTGAVGGLQVLSLWDESPEADDHDAADGPSRGGIEALQRAHARADLEFWGRGDRGRLDGRNDP